MQVEGLCASLVRSDTAFVSILVEHLKVGIHWVGGRQQADARGRIMAVSPEVQQLIAYTLVSIWVAVGVALASGRK